MSVLIGRRRCAWGFGVFLQAEDGIRDLVRSRGLGDVYKRQMLEHPDVAAISFTGSVATGRRVAAACVAATPMKNCLLYTSDAADERS